MSNNRGRRRGFGQTGAGLCLRPDVLLVGADFVSRFSFCDRQNFVGRAVYFGVLLVALNIVISWEYIKDSMKSVWQRLSGRNKI